MDDHYTRDTAGTVEEVCGRLTREAMAHRYLVLGDHDVKDEMHRRGLELAPDCRVLEICNPVFVEEAMHPARPLPPCTTSRIQVARGIDGVRVSMFVHHSVADGIEDPTLHRLLEATNVTLKRIIDCACSTGTRTDRVLSWNMC